MAIPHDLLVTLLIWLIPGIFAITLHEAAHGYAATVFGDPTAARLRRLSLNPLRHISLIGTLIMPITLLLMGSHILFGWAKPVPVNTHNLAHPRRDLACIALAGPLANLAMACLWACVIKLIYANGFLHIPGVGLLRAMANAGIMLNLLLMCFNLLPIPPLDGAKIIAVFFPQLFAKFWDKFQNVGWILLLMLVYFNLLDKIISPALGLGRRLLFAVFNINS